MSKVLPEPGSEQDSFRRWLFSKKQEMEQAELRPVSLTEFARRLGVGQASMSTWIHGTRHPSYEALLGVAEKLGDYSVLEIFGYTNPWLASLPAPLLAAFNQAALETSKRLDAAGIVDRSSSEAIEIAKKVFSEFGFTMNFTQG